MRPTSKLMSKQIPTHSRDRRLLFLSLLTVVVWWPLHDAIAELRPQRGQPGEQEILLDRPVPKRLSGREFSKKLAGRVNLVRESAGLLDILHDLQTTQNVAIVLDRRVDPTQTTTVKVTAAPLETAIHRVAHNSGNTARVIGSTVFVGPAESLTKLRTIITQRTNELRESKDVPVRQLRRLTSRNVVHWNDLDKPADITQRVADTNSVQLKNIDAMRHDLWRHGTLVGVNFVEAISVLLLQYDKTFTWNDDASEITIVPTSADIGIEQIHDKRRQSSEKLMQAIHARFPKLKVDTSSSRLKVFATVEQHEQIEAYITTGAWPPEKHELSSGQQADGDGATNQIPLSRRRITLRVIRKPAQDVIAALKKSGMDIRFDESEMKTAGVDLSQLIELEVTKVEIDQLFKAICEPIGVTFKITGEVIKLKPK